MAHSTAARGCLLAKPPGFTGFHSIAFRTPKTPNHHRIHFAWGRARISVGPRLGALQWERCRKTWPYQQQFKRDGCIGWPKLEKYAWRLDLSSRYSQSVGCSVDTILPRRGTGEPLRRRREALHRANNFGQGGWRSIDTSEPWHFGQRPLHRYYS